MKDLKLSVKQLTVYNITYFLAFLWILISIIKPIINYDGLERYQFIQRNTIGGWLLIFISLSLSKHFFKKYIHALWIVVVLFIIHEYLWYYWYIKITKDEGEVTNNWYSWANIYCNTITSKDPSKENTSENSDISEEIFDGDWYITMEEAHKKKYEKYFDLLQLKPGMKILDLGCGNCHWLQFCKAKGVETSGVSISTSQTAQCQKNGIRIYNGNINNGILDTIEEKFDAITAIGPAEHFTSISSPPDKCIEDFTKYYESVKKLIDPNSSCKRYLNTYMSENQKYSDWKSLSWNFHFYLVASAFGYGCYLPDDVIEKIYDSKNSKLITKIDYTEDYRWGGARTKEHWAKCNYKFDTPYRVFNFFRDVLVDPAWWQRALYGYFDCWLWQFGGSHTTPTPENKDTPTRSFIYVTEITPE